jgi:hypothetical protein
LYQKINSSRIKIIKGYINFNPFNFDYAIWNFR